jgi:hypothetical protein
MNRIYTLAFFLLVLTGGTALAQDPATAGSFTATCTDAGTVSWTNPGTVNNILVFAKAGSAITVGTPTNNITGAGNYDAANNDFSLAAQTYQNDAAARLVYRSSTSTNSFSLTGLTAGVTYHFLIFNASNPNNYSTALTFSGATLSAPPNPTGFAGSMANASSSLSWTNASCGDEILIVGRQGASVTGVPAGNGSAYTGNLNFTAATAPDFDAAAKTIYRGTSSPQVVTNLTNGTQYFFKIFTRKGTTWSSGVEVNVTPVPAAISGGNLSNVCTTSATVNWINPSPVENIIIFAKEGSAITVNTPTADISTTYISPSSNWSVPGTPYEHDASAFLVYNNTTGTSFNLTNLNAGATYHFLILNATGTTYSTAHTFNSPTLATPPVVTSLSNTPGGNSLSVNWTNPSSCIDEILVIARSGSAVTATPTGDGSAYTANNTFGSGSAVSAGQFAVYKGTGNSVNILGLTNGTTYHVSVFTRSGSIWSAGVSTSGVPVDTTPPTVSTLNPTDGALNFTVFGTQAVITFNENIQKISGAASTDNQRVRIFENGVVVSTLGRESASLSVSGSQLTITLPTLLANTDYYILIGNQVIEDLGGNDFAGLTNTTDWEFNTSGVTIAAPAALNVCAGAASRVLGDITIQETHPADFNGAGTFTLSFDPNSGFVFQSGTGSVTAEPVVSGQDVSISGLSVSFTSVTFTINLDGTNDELDRIRISGLRISSDGSTPSTNIRRSAGTSVVGGNSVANAFNHASISTGAAVLAPSGPSTSAFTLCQGSSIAGSQATFTSNNTTLRWYSDAAATSFLIQTQNPTATQLGLSSAAAGTFTVYATQTTTCESAPTAINFVVRATPGADAGSNLTGASAVCPNTPVVLGGNPTLSIPTVAPPPSYQYTWSEVTAFGASIPDPTVANPTVSLVNPSGATRTYIFQVVVTDPLGCQSSADQISVDVRSISQPVTFTQPTQFSYTTTDVAVVLRASPTGGVFSGIGVSIRGDGEYQFDPAQAGIGSFPVSYTVTLANGCQRTVSRNFSVTTFIPVFQNLTSLRYCSTESSVNLQITSSVVTDAQFFAASNPGLYQFNGLVRNYYSNATFYGNSTHVTATGSTYLPDGYQLYQFNPNATYPNCSNCNFAYIGIYIEYVNPALSGLPVGFDDGYSFNNGTTAGFLYRGQSVNISPVPFTSFSGLESGLVNPDDFCNINQTYQLVGSQNAGVFAVSINNGPFSVPTGLVNDNFGRATFNTQQIFGSNTSVIDVRVRYTINLTTTGSGGAACAGVFTSPVVQIHPLPSMSFSPSVPANNNEFCFESPNINLTTNQSTNVSYSGFGVLDNGNNTGAFSPGQGFTAQNPASTAPESIVVTATHRNSFGCPVTINRTFVVYPKPNSSYAIGPDNDGLYCFNGSGIQTFTGAVPPVGGSSAYTINYLGLAPAPPAATVAGSSLNFDPQVYFDNAANFGANRLSDIQFDVQYRVEDAIGCPSTFNRVITVSPQIDVTIVGVENNEEFCSNEGFRNLILTPQGGSLFQNNIIQVTTPAPGGASDRYNFGAPNGGTFNLRYEKISGTANCTNTVIKTVTILPSPSASFLNPSQCFDTPFSLSAQNNANTAQYRWFMDDGTPLLTTSTINHTYVQPNGLTQRDFSVKLTQIANPAGVTNRICRDSITKVIQVGSLPQVNFAFSRVCQGDNTSFTVASNLPIETYEWDFGDGSATPVGGTNSPIINVLNTSGTFGLPFHQYSSVSDFPVILKVRTPLGCPGEVNRTVSILTSLINNPSNPYLMENLGSGNGLWKVEDINGNTSWEFGVPDKPKIKAIAPLSSEKSWITDITAAYSANDVSYVNSPCFNLSAFDKPTLSIKYWIETEAKDGAVLQYSTNGGVNWQIVGTPTSGRNWFNAQSTISASPGGQSLYGWAGRSQEDWLVGKHSLSDIPGFKNPSTQVRLRIAFASDNSVQSDGFAFTDVRIEERNRLTLVESFTNVTAPSFAQNRTQFNALEETEAVKIQYHTSFPGDDPYNITNPVDHNARAAFYGLAGNLQSSTVVPRGYIDGISQGNFIGANDDEFLALQSLVSSPVSLSVSDLATDPGKIKASVTITALEDLMVNPLKNYKLFIAAVETQVGANDRFIMRKLLPDAAGLSIPAKSATIILSKNESAILTTEDISIPGVVDPTKLALVVFVQEINSKDILQAKLLPALSNPFTIITGVEPLLSDRIHIYPNPADRELTVELPAPAGTPMSLQLIDQLGRVAFSGTLNEGEQKKTISTETAAGGMYFIQIGTGKEAVRKKVLVVH